MLTIMDSLAEEYLCPILRVPMMDPVITEDGYTYERHAIENWFKTSSKSPITGLDLKSKQLIPNIALKNLKNLIIQKVPPIQTSVKYFEQQNQELHEKLRILQEEVSYLKQKSTQSQIITQQYQKLMKIEQKMVEQKRNIYQKEKKQKSKLQSQIKNINQLMNKLGINSEFQMKKMEKQHKIQPQKLRKKQIKNGQSCRIQRVGKQECVAW